MTMPLWPVSRGGSQIIFEHINLILSARLATLSNRSQASVCRLWRFCQRRAGVRLQLWNLQKLNWDEFETPAGVRYFYMFKINKVHLWYLGGKVEPCKCWDIYFEGSVQQLVSVSALEFALGCNKTCTGPTEAPNSFYGWIKKCRAQGFRGDLIRPGGPVPGPCWSLWVRQRKVCFCR